MAVVMVFSGEYDFGSRDKLRRSLDRLAFEAQVVLDLSRVTFIDSTCLAELLRLHQLREANELERLTVVLRPNGPIYRLLEVVNLTDVWRLADPSDEGVPAATS